MLTAGNDAGSYQFAYNADGEQTQVVTPSGVTLNYLYDANGNTTQVTDSLGDTVTSQYDANGNLLLRNATGPNGAQADVSLAYDSDNNNTTVVRLGTLLRLRLGGRVILTTAQHPFCRYNDGWVEAGHLRVGDRLLGGEGQRLSIESIEETDEFAAVYNPQVKGTP